MRLERIVEQILEVMLVETPQCFKKFGMWMARVVPADPFVGAPVHRHDDGTPYWFRALVSYELRFPDGNEIKLWSSPSLSVLSSHLLRLVVEVHTISVESDFWLQNRTPYFCCIFIVQCHIQLVPLERITDQIVEHLGACLSPRSRRTSCRIARRGTDCGCPRAPDSWNDSLPVILQERVQNRTLEQIVDFPVPRINGGNRGRSAFVHHRNACRIARWSKSWISPCLGFHGGNRGRSVVATGTRAESHAGANRGFPRASDHGGNAVEEVS